MSHYPLGDVLVKLWVKDGFLESSKRTVSVHQTTLHEHVTITFKVITGRAGLQRRHFLIKEAGETLGARTAACARVHFLHAADVTEFRLVFAVHTGAGAHLQAVLLTDGSRAHPIETDLRVSVTGCEVGFGFRGGTLSGGSVTHSLMSALRFLSTLLVAALVSTFGRTAGTLTGAAYFVGFQFAFLVIRLIGVIAAVFFALIAVAAVAFLAGFHQTVSTDRLSGFHKTASTLLLQHHADVFDAAHRELVVVQLVSRRRSGVHDVISSFFLVLAF